MSNKTFNLYITADKVGTQTGGGLATRQESLALQEFSEHVEILDATRFGQYPDPFHIDHLIEQYLEQKVLLHNCKIAHVYAGSFSRTVRKLKEYGVKVTYTAAAHDPQVSQAEFKLLGIPYDFPHMTDPKLWQQYVDGYIRADIVICPSQASKKLMKSFGCNEVTVIPHGTHAPESILPQPNRFQVGYLGQPGPDKGLHYLFRAWKKVNIKDGTLLLAGRQIEALHPLMREIGGGNVEFVGYVDTPTQLYNRCSVYVQPSATEGFGIEVLEAMAHGRPVIVSDGAGAADVVRHSLNGFVVPRQNTDAIADKITWCHANRAALSTLGVFARHTATEHSWEKIRQLYRDIWVQL